MNNPRKLTLTAVVSSLLILSACSTPEPDISVEMEVVPTRIPAPTEAALPGSPLVGGRLYDNWWIEAGLEAPQTDHPLWAQQTTNQRSGEDTWRCKECHGWDYLGAQGAYGSGSHFTGFPGIFDVRGEPASTVMAWLDGTENQDHDFSMLGRDHLEDLVIFIKEGLVFLEPIINEQTHAAVGGSVSDGGADFTEVCRACHGEDGRQLNFGTPFEPEYIGTLANENPWEFIHKVRVGQPGTEMPTSLEQGWGMRNVLDLLAYAQTLPVDPPRVGSIARGGRLYDSWWKESGVDEPIGDNPLWSRQRDNTRSGSDTWRCKECHGWDYLGAGGAYASGSHYTGFPGIFSAQDKSQGALIVQISGQADEQHNYAKMGAAAVADLVAFIRDGLIDMRSIIDAESGTPVDSDTTHGQELYQSNCAMCHGEEGRSLNFGDQESPEYVGTVAVDNPWEFIHKVRSGQPGTAMPAMIDAGLSMQDYADLLAFAQSLPVETP
ncbi:MAG: c-type cytochrome [Anaerolineales bacterium]|jgi:thiosulfate dehydrogenase